MQEAELSDYRDARMYSKEHLNNSYLQTGPTDRRTHKRNPEGHADALFNMAEEKVIVCKPPAYAPPTAITQTASSWCNLQLFF